MVAARFLTECQRLGGLSSRGLQQDRGGLEIAVEHGHAAGLEPVEDRGLLAGDAGHVLERLEMDGGDRGDHRDMRAGHHAQGRDLARIAHPDLDHGKLGVRGHPRQRQGHAPMVVVACLGRVGPVPVFADDAQHLLGRGLADRARHRDALALHPRPAGPAERAERLEHVGHDQKRRVLRDAVGDMGDHGRPGALLARLRDEVVPVPRRLQRDEEIARREGAGVDGDAVYGPVALQGAAGGLRGIRRGPEAHASLPSSAATATEACSASSKG